MATLHWHRNFNASRPLVAAIGISAAMLAASANAAFHLWTVKEIYSNANGTEEYIEFSTGSGGQNFLGGQTIKVTDAGTGTVNTFTIPSNMNLGGGTADTTNHDFIIATSTINSTDGVNPDYTLPAGFLFADGGTVQLVGTVQGAVSYAALPTDGVDALSFPGGTGGKGTPVVNDATNFAGMSAEVVPEPATWGLLAVGGIGCCLVLRRIGRNRPSVE